MRRQRVDAVPFLLGGEEPAALPFNGRISASLVRLVTRFLTVEDRVSLDEVDKAWHQTWQDPLGWSPAFSFRRRHIPFARLKHVRPRSISVDGCTNDFAEWVAQTQLVAFHCSYPETTHDVSKAIFEAAVNSPRLECLAIHGWDYLSSIGKPASPHIRVLCVNNCSVPTWALVDFIRSCPGLVHLNLNSCNLAGLRIVQLAAVLPELKQLRRLSLDLNDLGDHGFADIKPAVLAHPTLEWVGVRQNYLMDSVSFFTARTERDRPFFEWRGAAPRSMLPSAPWELPENGIV